MRVILFTGKGGVGKTSVAAATAYRCAELGYRTMIYSTDAAHSLSDSFDVEIGKSHTQIAPNLYGQEIDVNEELRRNWGPMEQFIEAFLKYKGFDNVIADELAVFPGMEEVFSLLELVRQYKEASFDVIVIDCAPTGETLRLLAAPDIAKWYMEKIFGIERQVLKAVRPVVKHLVDHPLPDDDVFASMESLYRNLVGAKELLTDRDVSSIRIVLNPEKMVIKESQKAYTFLHLFGYPVDMVVANRIIPKEVKDPYYRKWKEAQKTHLREVRNSFRPLPIAPCRLWDQEMVGKELLGKMAQEIYGKDDPATVFYKDKPIEIAGGDGNYVMSLELPFARKEDMDMWIRGDELVLQFRNYKRNILLPRALIGLELTNAHFAGTRLTITFGGETRGGTM